ncbi:hypothetical protein FHQ28_01545 [Pasteurellaceae bacterium USgator11]|nr:hypothetical protein FHQ20_09070 [Pasteurellaceae bacterium USgator41]TNG96940.1 hypothetical protein FHQ19_00900 [Pasteurellaceae bacterium UScroc12]TNG97856.1 hypothetical protein FHQ24_09685 [Pasteurellaceae bacterium UScroc31]TNH02911.1 hypothetical protein FHQ28_01545 [Pasteurellaceae bacterium USgator11]
MTVTFDNDGFALNEAEITVYITDSNSIYSHSDTEFVQIGTGLSAGAYLDAPPEPKDGFAIVRTENGWAYQPDHRGETVYSTIDQSMVEITELGDYPENTTTQKPECDCHVWDIKAKTWVLSDELKAAKTETMRSALIASIDNTAANISANWTRFTIEYQEREAAALVFKEHNFEGDPSVYVTSFSSAAGIDNKTAAELILQQAEGLRTLQSHLATQRMRKYELKKAELTEEELQSIHDDILHQMTMLAEAYE